MASLEMIKRFLDTELRITDFEDDSNNGLQVENSGNVSCVCTGVDATLDFFKKAAEKKADFLFCHHGISWGSSLSRITGMNYTRINFLMRNDMALYACHLPLDAHPNLGNNALICKKLGLSDIRPFGNIGGLALGFSGILPAPVSQEEFISSVRSIFGNIVGTMNFGKEKVQTVAVVSGGAAGEIMEAVDADIDVFISGEPKLTAYHIAKECRINAIFAGHYATEVFGVKEVASLLAEKFAVKAEFIDTQIPF